MLFQLGGDPRIRYEIYDRIVYAVSVIERDCKHLSHLVRPIQVEGEHENLRDDCCNTSGKDSRDGHKKTSYRDPVHKDEDKHDAVEGDDKDKRNKEGEDWVERTGVYINTSVV